jgi:hypothetical protein
MSEFREHLEKLKNYKTPGFLDGVNKLYFLEVDEKPNLVKIGDTHREVETRNDETIINSSLHIKNRSWVVAEKWDGSVFRDKSFHKFLEKKGYKRELNNKGTRSEWWYITTEKALEELAEFTCKPVYKTVELKTAQYFLLDQLQQAIDDGYQYINAGFCVRVGKTIISLTLSANNKWMPVYIGKNLTSQSSAESDNENFGIVPEMLTQSLHGVDELEEGELSKRTKTVIQNIEKANTANKSVIFFIDEVDDASHTKKSRDIITPVVEYFKEQNKFACIIPMSGTRIYRGEKILKELTDGAIKELSLEYFEMQILQPDTTCRREFRHISFYSEAKDGLANISDAMKNKDSGHKSLATVIEKLLGTNNFEFTVNPKFPHWFIKFATVGKNNAKKLVSYLNRNHSVIENKEYYFAEINGDVTTSKEAQEYCKDIIKEQSGKICVFITQGMATTSFSVVPIGNSAVFTDNELTADDIQALHRAVTWEEGKDWGNLIVVTTNDSMEHSFDDIFEDETKIAKTRGEKIDIYRELLNNNSMVHFTVNGQSVRPVAVTQENADKVIDQKAKAMTKVASIMNVVNDLDEEMLDNILLEVSGKKNSSSRSTSTKGDQFDPFGKEDDNTKSDKQDSNKITSAQKEKILRAFVEASVNVPAIAREQETTVEEFDFWNEIGITKELFFDVYNSSWIFKDRIDSIYNLCEDKNYLVKNYISKLVV